MESRPGGPMFFWRLTMLFTHIMIIHPKFSSANVKVIFLSLLVNEHVVKS